MNLVQPGKVNVMIGGQFGSEGKGKLAAWLYRHQQISACVGDLTPNAGHTFIDDDGKPHISKSLPVGAWFPGVIAVAIGPHSVINLESLRREIHDAQAMRGGLLQLHIHPLACVVTDKDRATEAASLSGIASTMQGTAQAQISKMMRNREGASLACDCVELTEMVHDTHPIVRAWLRSGRTVLAETCQGFDLGLNHGWAWPHVTSRDCLLGRVLDNAGAHPHDLGRTIVSLRTYPIRVGNTADGWSGPGYDDQQELTWGELSGKIGRAVCELTTVTKRVRRVFTWSNNQALRMLDALRPDFAFLNFVNYLTDAERDEFVSRVQVLLAEHGCRLALLGTGAGSHDMALVP